MGEWISVNDRLPEPCTDVLIFVDGVDGQGYGMRYCYIAIAYGDHVKNTESQEKWIWYADVDGIWYHFKDVKYWMPLPEFPEEIEVEVCK